MTILLPAIWIDALRSIVIPPALNIPPELGFLLPELAQPGKAPPDRSHLFDAVVQLLAQSASEAALIVILDDAGRSIVAGGTVPGGESWR